MTMTPTFGELIRETRLARGMSMGQLASSVGRTAASVRRWERDEVVPAVEVILVLAETLDLDPATLAALAAGAGDEDSDAGEAVPEPPPEAVPEPSPPVPEPSPPVPEPSPPVPEVAPVGETGAMPIAPPVAATTVSSAVTAEPTAERRTIRYYADHLFDADRPYLGYLRAALTVVVGLVLLWILIWAVGELFEALGRVWDDFDREETVTTVAAAVLRSPG
jgi:transcriptional regulator with XRE-family HTH domain